jgi:hypothetical protein
MIVDEDVMSLAQLEIVNIRAFVSKSIRSIANRPLDFLRDEGAAEPDAAADDAVDDHVRALPLLSDAARHTNDDVFAAQLICAMVDSDWPLLESLFAFLRRGAEQRGAWQSQGIAGRLRLLPSQARAQHRLDLSKQAPFASAPYNLVHYAVVADDPHVVEALLLQKRYVALVGTVDVQARCGAESVTALHMAACRGSRQAVQALVTAGAPNRALRSRFVAPLHDAVHYAVHTAGCTAAHANVTHVAADDGAPLDADAIAVTAGNICAMLALSGGGSDTTPRGFLSLECNALLAGLHLRAEQARKGGGRARGAAAKADASTSIGTRRSTFDTAGQRRLYAAAVPAHQRYIAPVVAQRTVANHRQRLLQHNPGALTPTLVTSPKPHHGRHSVSPTRTESPQTSPRRNAQVNVGDYVTVFEAAKRQAARDVKLLLRDAEVYFVCNEAEERFAPPPDGTPGGTSLGDDSTCYASFNLAGSMEETQSHANTAPMKKKASMAALTKSGSRATSRAGSAQGRRGSRVVVLGELPDDDSDDGSSDGSSDDDALAGRGKKPAVAARYMTALARPAPQERRPLHIPVPAISDRGARSCFTQQHGAHRTGRIVFVGTLRQRAQASPPPRSSLGSFSPLVSLSSSTVVPADTGFKAPDTDALHVDTRRAAYKTVVAVLVPDGHGTLDLPPEVDTRSNSFPDEVLRHPSNAHAGHVTPANSAGRRLNLLFASGDDVAAVRSLTEADVVAHRLRRAAAAAEKQAGQAAGRRQRGVAGGPKKKIEPMKQLQRFLKAEERKADLLRLQSHAAGQ